MNQLVSIIILNYNGKFNNSITLECIRSLKNQTYSNFEIILADNGSGKKYFFKLKNSVDKLKKELEIKLIYFKKNLFFTGAVNNLIKKAKGRFICLLNNDTEVLPDFIEKMADFLEKHRNVGMIAPKIMLYKNKDCFWYAGAKIDFRSEHPVKILGQWELNPQNQKYREISTTDSAAGAALFVRKSLIKKIGLLDEIFFFYHEDIDWNLRAQKVGYKSYYVPDTTIYHKVTRVKNKRRIIFSRFFFNRNSQILVWKHAKLSELISFYLKFGLVNLEEILFYILIVSIPRRIFRYFSLHYNLSQENRKVYRYLLYLQLNSLYRGFIAGIKRKLNLSCKSNIKRDYIFIERMERKIQSLNIEESNLLLSLFAKR
ncbi:MAG: glycosyltransferase family 2 protein [Promethearchaeota archaeon]